jgi:hypothetical protein
MVGEYGTRGGDATAPAVNALSVWRRADETPVVVKLGDRIARGELWQVASHGALQVQRKGRGIVVCLARQLIAAGVSPSRQCVCYRAGRRVFRPMPLAWWAGLQLEGVADREARLASHPGEA